MLGNIQTFLKVLIKKKVKVITMDDKVNIYPPGFQAILEATAKTSFDQLSDPQLGSLLSTLSATKPGGSFLELGTGSGLSTAWLLQGMDDNSSLVTVEENSELVDIAKKYLGFDPRVKFIVGKGENLILNTEPKSIDFIFADTWPGKYNHLEETLSLLKQGGVYIIDDMLPQDNWPVGHGEKVTDLIQKLENNRNLLLTKLAWSSGIIICIKKF